MPISVRPPRVSVQRRERPGGPRSRRRPSDEDLLDCAESRGIRGTDEWTRSGRPSERPLARRRGPRHRSSAATARRRSGPPTSTASPREGVRYTRAYTTAPVCSASRSAFMTGMYQTTIGAHNHRSHRDDGYRLPDGVQVISDCMRDAGYFTANVRQLPASASASPARGRPTGTSPTTAQPFDSDRWADLKGAPAVLRPAQLRGDAPAVPRPEACRPRPGGDPAVLPRSSRDPQRLGRLPRRGHRARPQGRPGPPSARGRRPGRQYRRRLHGRSRPVPTCEESSSATRRACTSRSSCAGPCRFPLPSTSGRGRSTTA